LRLAYQEEAHSPDKKENHMRLMIKLAVAVLALHGTAFAQQLTKFAIDSVSVTDLQTYDGGAESAAQDINDLGDVVGWSLDHLGKQHAVVSFGGTGFLTLHDGSVPWTNGIARSINNDQVVVGSYNEAFLGYRRPFYYFPGIWLTGLFSTPVNAYDWTASANAINENHKIVGEASLIYDPNNPPPTNVTGLCYLDLAIQWSTGSDYPFGLFCIPDPDGNGTWLGQGLKPRANDINLGGDVVGTDGGKTVNSMFVKKGANIVAVPRPAGMSSTQNGQQVFGQALGINDQGFVAGGFGYITINSPAPISHAFVWDGVSASSTDLGTLPNGTFSVANKINNQKIAVGSSERKYSIPSATRTLAFIHHPDFGLVQLPSLEYTTQLGFSIPSTCMASSLNQRKNTGGLVQVVGACHVAGKWRAVRWDVVVKLKPLVQL